MNPHTAFPNDAVLPYMHDVDRCDRSLHELSLMWRTIESSAKMNCPAEARSLLPAIAATRSGFTDFRAALVNSLVHEKMGNVQAELATAAQTIIDVVVRNLYERTADVSFLATDRELCGFVAAGEEERAAGHEAVRRRLRAYRDKYTVYDEIILLDTQGKVLAHIDDGAALERSGDPLVQATLARGGYLETFRATDLRPSRRAALVYSHRMCDPHSGAVAGVLCLCFSFEEEMQGIFESLGAGAGRAGMLLLDGANRVIASADPLWIPVGTRVPAGLGDSRDPVLFAGRRYLVRTFATDGYQGYPGPPGWQGQVMVPLDLAFGAADSALPAAIDPGWAAGLLAQPHAFCPPLVEIQAAAAMIRRVVWNVQLMTTGAGEDMPRLESILEQISDTGRRSSDMFSQSIRDLFRTALGTGLHKAAFMSRLLVDLHDRNLYERANDCRWWALSPALRALVAGALPDRAERIGRILDEINRLYTVYTSIFVYDGDGLVLAGSGEDGVECLDAATLAQVLALRSEQAYHVSPFDPSPHYGGRPTYVFHAAIRNPADDSRVIGGIGLVFDAETEFRAMLDGVMGGRDDLAAFFIAPGGAILASSDPAHPAGSTLDIDHALLSAGRGDSAADVLVHRGRHAIMGSTMSSGYREFKNGDGYRADVIAVVIQSFGEAKAGSAPPDTLVSLAGGGRSPHSSAAYATFVMSGQTFALAAAEVCEALPSARMSPVTMGSWGGRAGVLALDEGAGGSGYVWVFDLGVLLAGTSPTHEAGAEVIVVRRGSHAVGLLVGGLHSVARFDQADILPVPFGSTGGSAPVRQIIKANGGECLIQVIDVDCLFGMLDQPQVA